MNRDELAAATRGVITVSVGAALIYCFAQWLGWWWTGAMLVVAAVDGTLGMPPQWRPW